MPTCSVCGTNHSVNVRACPCCGRKFTSKTQRCKAMTSGAGSPPVKKRRGIMFAEMLRNEEDFGDDMPVPRIQKKRRKPAAKKSGNTLFGQHVGHIMDLQSHARRG